LPLLQDVFEAFPDVGINIDLKHAHPLLPKKVAELVKKHCRQHNTIWGSARESTASQLLKLEPSVALFFSTRSFVKVVLAFYCGLLPFLPLKESFLEIPLLTDEVVDYVKRRTGKGSKSSICCISLQTRSSVYLWLVRRVVENRSLIEHLKRRGIKTILWVGNCRKDFAEAYQLGADGVMTDYPLRLTNYLEQDAPVSQHARVRQAAATFSRVRRSSE